MAEKEWIIRQPELSGLFEGCGYSRVLSVLLANRGIADEKSAADYLACAGKFHDPYEMAGMDKAVERISHAVNQHEKIVIYGDYDVDGVTATALLFKALRSMGAEIGCYIPDRESEGYGLNSEAVRRIAAEGANLIVTVDTGISAIDEAKLLGDLGVDLVITDHHEPREELPNACAVVNPKQADCPYPFKGLAGVGVAYKLACALTGAESDQLLRDYGPLVCLGTVADVVPLTGENRLLVSRGLRQMSDPSSCGCWLQALLGQTGIADKKLTAGLLSFTLAPRINACGRMASANDAFKLLVTDDQKQAEALAERLDENNRLRQTVENKILLEAVASIEADENLLNNPVLMVAGEGWHNGVIGIVASRLTERYQKPCLVVSFEGNLGRASCRSVEGFNLHQALENCSSLLERFGGHEMAAGFTVRREHYNALYSALITYAQAMPEQPKLRLYLDCELEPEELTLETAKSLSILEPCGSANPSPLFYIEGVSVNTVTPVGGGSHLRLGCRKDGARFEAMAFHADKRGLEIKPGDSLDLAVSLDINQFRGRESLSVIIRDIRPAIPHRRQKLLYESFLQGRLSSSEQVYLPAAVPVPAREEFAAVYRVLSSSGQQEVDLDMICTRLCGQIKTFGYFKLRLILDVFNELGLITYTVQGELLGFEINREKKVDLNTSQLLRQVSQGANIQAANRS